ncbi:Nudix family hydrolase [Permianibacter aggregans]|uniref:8-oxo-dGTP diphosphatase n=1 Tax=Permianibacter aggregans TaxID=1510150 RepID=A0A4R6UD90_9GAMM|nr:Nudix family hydrolase [Permianibacter aggregans]QGX39021.1 Nudix family hydrolase [Permianibacter aggregans]TDQ44641.1 8-oxo-dGTPase [Permianibacter aggregans]
MSFFSAHFLFERHEMDKRKIIDVAAAAIVDGQGQVLLAQRLAHLHQGGKWEFPGGKFEPGETAEQALLRELHEELDITVHDYQPLIRLVHQYPEKSVRLHVFTVTRFSGLPKGKEGQALQWADISRLRSFQFPDANYPIVSAVQLPDLMLITPALASFNNDVDQLMLFLQQKVANGVSLMQLRLPDCDDATYLDIVKRLQASGLLERCRLMLNRNPKLMARFANVGWHISGEHVEAAQAILAKGTRPDWLSTSVHSRDEWHTRRMLEPDFVLLSPVKATASHPDRIALGWEQFAEIAEEMNCPVFALGGMNTADLIYAKQNGAQGIAGIRCFQ